MNYFCKRYSIVEIKIKLHILAYGKIGHCGTIRIEADVVDIRVFIIIICFRKIVIRNFWKKFGIIHFGSPSEYVQVVSQDQVQLSCLFRCV